jgi:hypothetical protein
VSNPHPLPSPLSLSLEPLADFAATYAADVEVARALRASGAWRPWADSSPGGSVWYADPWEELGEPLAGWQASGGLQGRRCRVYLVRMPEPRLHGNRYPAERGRWALRDVETVGPAAGYGITRFFRGEAAARAGVEEAARCAQAIGNCYLGTGSAAAVAAQVAEDVRGARSRAWLAAYKWTPRGYELRPGCVDPAEQWTETPEQCGERAARGGT